LGFISTSVLLRLGVELVDSLYASLVLSRALADYPVMCGEFYMSRGEFLSVWDGDIGWLASNMSSKMLGGFFSRKGRK